MNSRNGFTLRQVVDDRRGASGVEFIIVVALVALGGVAAYKAFGSHILGASGDQGRTVVCVADTGSGCGGGAGTALPSGPPAAGSPPASPTSTRDPEPTPIVNPDVAGKEGPLNASAQQLGLTTQPHESDPYAGRNTPDPEQWAANPNSPGRHDFGAGLFPKGDDDPRIQPPREPSLCTGTSCPNPAENQCFVAGTPVLTPHGLVPIQDIREGDLVASRAQEVAQADVFSDGDGVVFEPVVRTFVHGAPSLVELRIEDAADGKDTIRVTPQHRFWTLDRGWRGAEDLAAGEALSDDQGHELRVLTVTPLDVEASVYNFEVAATHTYFVGKLHAWVHNICRNPDHPINEYGECRVSGCSGNPNSNSYAPPQSEPMRPSRSNPGGTGGRYTDPDRFSYGARLDPTRDQWEDSFRAPRDDNSWYYSRRQGGMLASAYDPFDGRFYTGISGGPTRRSNEYARLGGTHPQVGSRLSPTTQERWPTNNCAEVAALNRYCSTPSSQQGPVRRYFDDPSPSGLFMQAQRPRDPGTRVAPCRNCAILQRNCGWCQPYDRR